MWEGGGGGGEERAENIKQRTVLDIVNLVGPYLYELSESGEVARIGISAEDNYSFFIVRNVAFICYSFLHNCYPI